MTIRHEMTRAEYDALDAVNWSTLRHLNKSPLAYDHACSRPRTDSAAMRLGRAAHMAVLEPERFRSDCIVYDGVRRGKAWDAFLEENADREVLTEEEHAQAMCISLSVQSHPVARELLSLGRAEVSLVADLDGTPCKGRLDWIGRGSVIVDLKTTRSSCHPRSFSRSALTYDYHGQAAFYTMLAKQCGLEPSAFCFIVAESVAPYEVAVYRVSPDVMELGRDMVRSLLNRRAECFLERGWGHEHLGTLELTFPSWAYGDDGDALEGCE
jgi:exodeoxyribonuclease VIII